jgi:hypothetical protein
MRATIALGNVVGEAQAPVRCSHCSTAWPLQHRCWWPGRIWTIAGGVEDIGIQHLLAFVDEFHKSFDTTCAGKVIFLARALIQQADASRRYSRSSVHAAAC